MPCSCRPPAMPCSSSEYIIPVLFLACVGGVIGAVAGAAREIVAAQRPKAFDPGGGV